MDTGGSSHSPLNATSSPVVRSLSSEGSQPYKEVGPSINISPDHGSNRQPHERVSEFLRKVDTTRQLPPPDMIQISTADILSAEAPRLRHRNRKRKDGTIKSSPQGIFSDWGSNSTRSRSTASKSEYSEDDDEDETHVLASTTGRSPSPHAPLELEVSEEDVAEDSFFYPPSMALHRPTEGTPKKVPPVLLPPSSPRTSLHPRGTTEKRSKSSSKNPSGMALRKTGEEKKKEVRGPSARSVSRSRGGASGKRGRAGRTLSRGAPRRRESSYCSETNGAILVEEVPALTPPSVITSRTFGTLLDPTSGGGGFTRGSGSAMEVGGGRDREPIRGASLSTNNAPQGVEQKTREGSLLSSGASKSSSRALKSKSVSRAKKSTDPNASESDVGGKSSRRSGEMGKEEGMSSPRKTRGKASKKVVPTSVAGSPFFSPSTPPSSPRRGTRGQSQKPARQKTMERMKKENTRAPLPNEAEENQPSRSVSGESGSVSTSSRGTLRRRRRPHHSTKKIYSPHSPRGARPPSHPRSSQHDGSVTYPSILDPQEPLVDRPLGGIVAFTSSSPLAHPFPGSAKAGGKKKRKEEEEDTFETTKDIPTLTNRSGSLSHRPGRPSASTAKRDESHMLPSLSSTSEAIDFFSSSGKGGDFSSHRGMGGQLEDTTEGQDSGRPKHSDTSFVSTSVMSSGTSSPLSSSLMRLTQNVAGGEDGASVTVSYAGKKVVEEVVEEDLSSEEETGPSARPKQRKVNSTRKANTTSKVQHTDVANPPPRKRHGTAHPRQKSSKTTEGKGKSVHVVGEKRKQNTRTGSPTHPSDVSSILFASVGTRKGKSAPARPTMRRRSLVKKRRARGGEDDEEEETSADDDWIAADVNDRHRRGRTAGKRKKGRLPYVVPQKRAPKLLVPPPGKYHRSRSAGDRTPSPHLPPPLPPRLDDTPPTTTDGKREKRPAPFAEDWLKREQTKFKRGSKGIRGSGEVRGWVTDISQDASPSGKTPGRSSFSFWGAKARESGNGGGAIMESMKRDLDRLASNVKAMGEDFGTGPSDGLAPPSGASSTAMPLFFMPHPPSPPPPGSPRMGMGGLGGAASSVFGASMSSPLYPNPMRPIGAAASMPPFLVQRPSVELSPQLQQQLGLVSSYFAPVTGSTSVFAPDRSTSSFVGGGAGGNLRSPHRPPHPPPLSAQAIFLPSTTPTPFSIAAQGRIGTSGGGPSSTTGGAASLLYRSGRRPPSGLLSPMSQRGGVVMSPPPAAGGGVCPTKEEAAREAGTTRPSSPPLVASSFGGVPPPLPSLPVPILLGETIATPTSLLPSSLSSTSPTKGSRKVWPTTYDVAASLPTDGAPIPAQLLVECDSYLVIPVQVGEEQGALKIPPGLQPTAHPWITSFIPGSRPTRDALSTRGTSLATLLNPDAIPPTPSSHPRTPPSVVKKEPETSAVVGGDEMGPPTPRLNTRGPSIPALRNEIATLTDEVAESLQQCYESLNNATTAAQGAPEWEQQQLQRVVEAKEQVLQDTTRASEHIVGVLQTLLEALEKLEQEEEGGGGTDGDTGEGGKRKALGILAGLVGGEDEDVEDVGSVSRSGLLNTKENTGEDVPGSFPSPPSTAPPTTDTIAEIIGHVRQEFFLTQQQSDVAWQTVEQELAEEDAKHRATMDMLLRLHRQKRHRHHRRRHHHDGDKEGSKKKKKSKDEKRKMKGRRRMKNRKTSTSAPWVVPPPDLMTDVAVGGSQGELEADDLASKWELVSNYSRLVQVPSLGHITDTEEDGQRKEAATERRDASCSPHSVFLDLLEQERGKHGEVAAASSPEWIQLPSKSPRSGSAEGARPLYHRTRGSPGGKFFSSRGHGKEDEERPKALDELDDPSAFPPLRNDVIWVFPTDMPSEEEETLEVVRLWQKGLPPAPSPLPSESDEDDEETSGIDEEEEEDVEEEAAHPPRAEGAAAKSTAAASRKRKRHGRSASAKVPRWGGGGVGAPPAVTTWLEGPSESTESIIKLASPEGKRERK